MNNFKIKFFKTFYINNFIVHVTQKLISAEVVTKKLYIYPIGKTFDPKYENLSCKITYTLQNTSCFYNFCILIHKLKS